MGAKLAPGIPSEGRPDRRSICIDGLVQDVLGYSVVLATDTKTETYFVDGCFIGYGDEIFSKGAWVVQPSKRPAEKQCLVTGERGAKGFHTACNVKMDQYFQGFSQHNCLWLCRLAQDAEGNCYEQFEETSLSEGSEAAIRNSESASFRLLYPMVHLEMLPEEHEKAAARMQAEEIAVEVFCGAVIEGTIRAEAPGKSGLFGAPAQNFDMNCKGSWTGKPGGFTCSFRQKGGPPIHSFVRSNQKFAELAKALNETFPNAVRDHPELWTTLRIKTNQAARRSNPNLAPFLEPPQIPTQIPQAVPGQALQGLPISGEAELGDQLVALTAPLEGMKIRELETCATKWGATEKEKENAIEAKAPKVALQNLITTKMKDRITSLKALRNGELRERAGQLGASDDAIDSALEDPGDVKAALVKLVLNLEANPSPPGGVMTRLKEEESSVGGTSTSTTWPAASVNTSNPAADQALLGAWSSLLGHKYKIDDIDGSLVYSEGNLSGTLEPQGEWYVASLYEGGVHGGTIRLKREGKGMKSNFAPRGSRFQTDVQANREEESPRRTPTSCGYGDVVATPSPLQPPLTLEQRISALRS